MAVVRDFYLENGCHFKINDAELLPEEERIEVIHRLERIVVQPSEDFIKRTIFIPAIVLPVMAAMLTILWSWNVLIESF
mgnify:CR=1 FL=1